MRLADTGSATECLPLWPLCAQTHMSATAQPHRSSPGRMWTPTMRPLPAVSYGCKPESELFLADGVVFSSQALGGRMNAEHERRSLLLSC